MKKNPLEEQILQTAEELFLEKGFDATSTTDIAKKVGCNQALVHYYFRTKENLFMQIFAQKSAMVFECLKLRKDSDFRTALSDFIDAYFELLMKNRKLPFFIINELIMRDDRRQYFRKKVIESPDYIAYYGVWNLMLQKEITEGRIRPIELADLTLHVVSLLVFTFISLPLYSDFFEKDETEICTYLNHRKEAIKELIFKGIFIKE
ncbi:MAG: TetR/AcrR family transcriptional regulator [Bacteroidales bacterium]|nr:TetR/AcrR family transcriptional regulator [Bacteroidales bacterium]